MKLRYQTLSGGRTLGEIEVPTTTGGKVVVSAPGDDKAEALARVATIAQRIAADPVMMMLMPQSVHDDLEELRLLASAACHSPEELREVCGELGITASGADASTRRKGRLHRNPKHKLATDLHAVAKGRQNDDDGGGSDDDDGDDGDDDGGYDDGADNGYYPAGGYPYPPLNPPAPGYPGASPYAPGAAPYVPPYAAPPVARPQMATRRLGDIVNGRGRSIDGFWDDVSNIASQAGSAAWQLAKDHRKELAMAAAGAAFGPGGAVAAGKAMDALHAAQAGHPDAQQAVKQIAAKSDAGDPKAKIMATVIKKELVTQAAHEQAAQPSPAAMTSARAMANTPGMNMSEADIVALARTLDANGAAAQPEHTDDPGNDGHPDVERDHGEGTEAFDHPASDNGGPA